MIRGGLGLDGSHLCKRNSLIDDTIRIIPAKNETIIHFEPGMYSRVNWCHTQQQYVNFAQVMGCFGGWPKVQISVLLWPVQNQRTFGVGTAMQKLYSVCRCEFRSGAVKVAIRIEVRTEGSLRFPLLANTTKSTAYPLLLLITLYLYVLLCT